MILKSSIENFFNSIHDFYISLSVEGQLVTYILIILIFIAITLIIILTEQKRIAKKIANKKPVQPVSENTEKLDFDFEEIDVTNEKTRNLKEITDKIQAVLDNKAIDLTNFEQDQEENSIISYNELINSVGKKQETPKVEFKAPDLIHKIEADEDIRIRDEQAIIPSKEDMKEEKFKSSVFVSPIFGIQEPDKVLIKEDIKEEKQPEILSSNYSDEESFLNNLINFRKNLE